MGKVVNLPNTKKVEFGGLELNLRLSGRSILGVEKRLGKSLMALFLSDTGGFKLPPSNELLIVLQGANQTHGVKESDVIEAFENFLDEGHTTVDLQQIIQELLEESGFFGKENDTKATDSEEDEALTLDVNPMMDSQL